jgi:hypothetical protein
MKKTLIIFTLLVMTSCASVFKGTTDTLHISSYEKGSKIYVNNILVGTDNVVFEHSKKDLGNTMIVVKKDGCKDSHVLIEGEPDPVAAANCIFLCLPGVVDLFTCAWQEAAMKSFYITPYCKQ